MNREGVSSMKTNNIMITVLICGVVGVGGFFAGMQFQKAQQPEFVTAQFKGGTMMQQGGRTDGRGMGTEGTGGQMQASPVSGEITSVDGNTITIQMPDGSSKIVILSDETKINKSSEGSQTDLKTGEQVTAFGEEGSDGSITAANISLGGTMFRIQGEPKN